MSNSQWTGWGSLESRLHLWGLGQRVNLMSFTRDRCHDVCIAEPAFTWLTVRHNNGNSDKWMTWAFESGMIILSPYSKRCVIFVIVDFQHCCHFILLYMLYMGYILQLMFTVILKLMNAALWAQTWSLCFLLCCETSAASTLWVWHLNYIPAIMQSAQP